MFLKEKRRIQRNDPEVQVRHRDVADRLRTNYSSSSAVLNNSTDSNSNLGRNLNKSTNNTTSSTSSRTNIDQLTSSAATTLTKGFKSVKDVIASKVPAFIYKPKPDSNYFIFYFLTIIF